MFARLPCPTASTRLSSSGPTTTSSFQRVQSRQVSVTVRAASDVDNLLKKPDLKRPATPEQPPKTLFGEAAPAAAASTPAAASKAPSSPASSQIASSSNKVVTVEYQRQRAKEIRKFFQDSKVQQSASQARGYGWVPSAEITNGRWVMFGFAVGLLTEYATGVDFIDQLKLIVTYLGISDLD